MSELQNYQTNSFELFAQYSSTGSEPHTHPSTKHKCTFSHYYGLCLCVQNARGAYSTGSELSARSQHQAIYKLGYLMRRLNCHVRVKPIACRELCCVHRRQWAAKIKKSKSNSKTLIQQPFTICLISYQHFRVSDASR